MNMKKVLILFIAWCMTLSVAYAQQDTTQVKVKYLNSFDAALKEAAQANKLIFVNCYAHWALPCQGMDRHVFSNAEFAKWLNDNFVCLRLEMTDPQNRYLIDKYKIRFYAHFLVLDSEGNLVHRVVGGAKLPKFKEWIARALNPNESLTGMDRRYESGERSVEFLRDYIEVLSHTNETDKQEVLTKEFLAKIDTSDLVKKENLEIFFRIVGDVNSDYYKYLIRHYDDFIEENGKEPINRLISNLNIVALLPYFFSEEGYDTFDIDGIKQIIDKYLPADDKVFAYYKAAKARGEGRVEDYISLLQSYKSELEDRVIRDADLSLTSCVKKYPETKQLIESYLKSRMNEYQSYPDILRAYEQALFMLENEGKGVKFEDCSFDEALVLAAKSGKLLFMDCYTSWCGPCKMLSDKIFPLKEVGDFFNQHFINIKMDMEKGEGKDLAKRYKVRSYPTLLVLDAKGNIVHRLSGARPPKDLLVLMARALSEETAYAPVKAKYEAGDRSPRVVVEYLLNMRLTGEMGEEMIQKKAEEYFQSLSDEQRLDKYMLYFFKNFASDPESDMALYFLKHRKSYDKIEQDMDPEELLLRIYFPALMNYLPEANLQDERLAHLIQVIKDAGYVKDKMTLGYLVNIIEAVGENNWKEVKKIYFKKVAKMTDMRGQLNLDVLWNRLWVKTPDSMKAEVIEYLKAEKAKTIEPSIDNYEMLLEKLQQ